MGLLANVKTDASVENDTDSVGGGFAVLDTDVYEMTVKHAFVVKSATDATGLTLHLTGPKGELLRETVYMTSGKAKGCTNTYVDKKTGKTFYLPGFNLANSLAQLTVEKEIGELEPEIKVMTIKLYDHVAKTEVDTDVDMVMPLIGQKIFAGVFKQTVNKRKLDEASGKYVDDLNEVQEENKIDKFFCAVDGYRHLTLLELIAGETQPVFMQKWLDKWQGQVKDKTSKKAPVSGGAPKRESGASAPKKRIFA